MKVNRTARKAQGLCRGVIVLCLLSFGLGCKSQLPVVSQGPRATTPEEAILYFKAELSGGYIDSALLVIHPSSQARISGLLQEMKELGTLGDFARAFGRMEAVRVGQDVAEYNFFEEGDPEPLTVTFMKVNGNWLISSFG